MRCAILFEQKRSSAFAYALVAQLDRVSGYEPEGRGFESLPAYQKAVERFCVLRLFIMFWIGKIRQKLLPWSETMIIQTGMRTDIPAFYSQ